MAKESGGSGEDSLALDGGETPPALPWPRGEVDAGIKFLLLEQKEALRKASGHHK